MNSKVSGLRYFDLDDFLLNLLVLIPVECVGVFLDRESLFVPFEGDVESFLGLKHVVQPTDLDTLFVLGHHVDVLDLVVIDLAK